MPSFGHANVLSFLVFIGHCHLGVWGRSNEVHSSYNLQSSSPPYSFQKNVLTLWLVTFITFFWSCICTTIRDFHWLLSSWYLVPPLWDPSAQGKGNESTWSFYNLWSLSSLSSFYVNTLTFCHLLFCKCVGIHTFPWPLSYRC